MYFTILELKIIQNCIILKHSLAGYQTSGWWLFSHSTLNILFCCFWPSLFLLESKLSICLGSFGFLEFRLFSLSLSSFFFFFFSFLFFFFFVVFLSFCLFRAAHGGSQARGLIRATAASLCHSHSNAGSELHLQPTPQLTAMLDP